MPALDPHQRPPDGIRAVYKKYQKMRLPELSRDTEIVTTEGRISNSKITVVKTLDSGMLKSTFQEYLGGTYTGYPDSPVPVYEHADMPGLHIIPQLLPPEVQLMLLSGLLHRDLSCPSHLTNIHTHYNLAYPNGGPDTTHSSFFSIPPTCPDHIATPLDPSVHKPLTISQLLTKKMRWATLGGQYDWTAKQYPNAEPPPFPQDTKDMLEAIFEGTKAEAAIVNLYSPGDTLSVHRDVAESCATGLISVSLGCDAVFVIGTVDEETGEEKVLTLRLSSGSAVYMSGPSRFAWHGVPQIVPNTCPEYLAQWPAREGDGRFEAWRGWMRTKRVNLNVRQMYPD